MQIRKETERGVDVMMKMIIVPLVFSYETDI